MAIGPLSRDNYRPAMFLLDTCSLLWLASDRTGFSPTALAVIEDPVTRLYVSAISAFEIALLSKKGRIQLGSVTEIWFAKAIANYSLRPLAISWEIALQSAQLQSIHNDPSDRLIIATAVAHDLTILSPDRYFASYPGVKTLW